MTITDFVKGNVILVAVVIVILYFGIRYLFNKGYFDKFGIKDIKFNNPNSDFFKTEDKVKESKEDFFATGPETKKIGDDNYFKTDLDKKWFEKKI